MPSSVSVGSRPMRSRIRAYSSGVSPCSATSSGVTFGSVACVDLETADVWALTPFPDHAAAEGARRPGGPAHRDNPGPVNTACCRIFWLGAHGCCVRRLRLRPGHADHLPGIVAERERRVGALDPQAYFAAQELDLPVAEQDPRQQFGLAENLKSVADADREPAAPHVTTDRLHDRRMGGDCP